MVIPPTDYKSTTYRCMLSYKFRAELEEICFKANQRMGMRVWWMKGLRNVHNGLEKTPSE